MVADNKFDAQMAPIQHFMQVANKGDEGENYRISILNGKCAIMLAFTVSRCINNFIIL